MTRYRDTKTGFLVSKATWKRSKAHGGTRYKREIVKEVEIVSPIAIPSPQTYSAIRRAVADEDRAIMREIARRQELDMLNEIEDNLEGDEDFYFEPDEEESPGGE